MKTDTYISIDCNSVFAPFIHEYVEFKRTCGYKFNTESSIMRLFDSFCVESNIASPLLDKKLLDAWSVKRNTENSTTHQLRVRIIRGFSMYLYQRGFDSPNTFHPLPHISNDFIPYIFSEAEIKRLFVAIDEQNKLPIAVSPLRHRVIPVLFRMIYGCGLRENEALRLKKKDVLFADRSVRILNTKGEQDRIVVMSDTLSEVCYNYACLPEVRDFESEYFFPSADHLFYANRTIYEYFRKALFLAGIAHRGRGNGPRLHDLRHTYAVHVLSRWQKEGKDLYVCLPILCDYLGHKNLKSTERYLQLVPESYDEVTTAFTKKFNGIFPEVNYEAE